MSEATEILGRLAHELDEQLAHVWMVRTFLKHSEEAEEDEELCDVHRTLYDYMHALGGPLESGDHAQLFKMARKKWSKLRKAAELWTEIQPEISGHTSFQMSRTSLNAAVRRIGELLDAADAAGKNSSASTAVGNASAPAKTADDDADSK